MRIRNIMMTFTMMLPAIAFIDSWFVTKSAELFTYYFAVSFFEIAMMWIGYFFRMEETRCSGTAKTTKN